MNPSRTTNYNIICRTYQLASADMLGGLTFLYVLASSELVFTKPALFSCLFLALFLFPKQRMLEESFKRLKGERPVRRDRDGVPKCGPAGPRVRGPLRILP